MKKKVILTEEFSYLIMRKHYDQKTEQHVTENIIRSGRRHFFFFLVFKAM